MKNKKLKLEDLKVKSFITSMEPKEKETVEGGDTIGVITGITIGITTAITIINSCFGCPQPSDKPNQCVIV